MAVVWRIIYLLFVFDVHVKLNVKKNSESEEHMLYYALLIA